MGQCSAFASFGALARLLCALVMSNSLPYDIPRCQVLQLTLNTFWWRLSSNMTGLQGKSMKNAYQLSENVPKLTPSAVSCSSRMSLVSSDVH